MHLLDFLWLSASGVSVGQSYRVHSSDLFRGGGDTCIQERSSGWARMGNPSHSRGCFRGQIGGREETLDSQKPERRSSLAGHFQGDMLHSRYKSFTFEAERRTRNW